MKKLLLKRILCFLSLIGSATSFATEPSLSLDEVRVAGWAVLSPTFIDNAVNRVTEDLGAIITYADITPSRGTYKGRDQSGHNYVFHMTKATKESIKITLPNDHGLNSNCLGRPYYPASQDTAGTLIDAGGVYVREANAIAQQVAGAIDPEHRYTSVVRSVETDMGESFVGATRALGKTVPRAFRLELIKNSDSDQNGDIPSVTNPVLEELLKERENIKAKYRSSFNPLTWNLVDTVTMAPIAPIALPALAIVYHKVYKRTLEENTQRIRDLVAEGEIIADDLSELRKHKAFRDLTP